MSTYTVTPAHTALADALSVPDGGFTVQVWTNRRPSTGYAVSVFDDAEWKIQSSKITGETIARYLDRFAGRLTDPDVHFGGWTDPETMISYLDLSVLVDSVEDAEQLARDHGQLAYYSLADGQSVYVTPTL